MELLTEEKVREGYSQSEARRRALIELGGVEQVRAKVREIRVGRLLEGFASNLQFTVRQLRHSPGSRSRLCSRWLPASVRPSLFSPFSRVY